MAYFLSPDDLLHLQSSPSELKFTRPPCTFVPLSPSSPSTPIIHPSPSSPSLQFDVFASYALIFEYGAIVFFNTPDSAQHDFFDALPHRPAARLKDDYTIVVDPTLAHSPSSSSPSSAAISRAAGSARPASSSSSLSCHFAPDSLYLSSLDAYSVRIIAQVLAQTVGMESYEQRASSMLSEFHSLSLHMARTGALPHSSSTQLIHLLAANNTILTTVLTHLRLLDRSEIAWRHGLYHPLWQGLREEFDLDGRYETLETKLRLLQENHPLFLEVLHHKQGTRMEVIIIALIAIEVLLAVVFHSPILGFVMEKLGYEGVLKGDKKEGQWD